MARLDGLAVRCQHYPATGSPGVTPGMASPLTDWNNRVGRSSSRKKSEKRSIIANRGLVWRVLAYAMPHKGSIVLAIALSILTAFLGTATLLPLIPIINVLVQPEILEQRQSELELGLPENAQVETAKSATSDLQERFPWFGRLVDSAKQKKEEYREKIYRFLLDQREKAIGWIVLFLMFAVAIKALANYQSRFLMTRVLYQAIQKIKVDLYTSSLALDFTALNERTSGNLIARLSSDVGKLRTVLQAILMQSVEVPFELLFLTILLLYLSPGVTVITLLGIVVVVVPIVFLSKKLRRLSRKDAEEDAYLVDVMQETLQGMQIVKAFGSEKRESKRFKEVSRGQMKRQIRRMKLALAAPVISEILTTGAMGLVIIAGSYIVMVKGAMTPGDFVIYLFALSRFYKPIKSLTSTYVRLQRGLASADRVFEIIDTRPTVIEKEDAIDLPAIEKEISFEDVTFSYVEGREVVLDGFTMIVPKGKQYALVGASGAGKSTVMKLLPRFYDPSSGAIRIDGHDIRDVTFASLRGQIAIVTQETILFDSTIYENISYGKQNATPEEVERVARAANAHDFIMDLPEGYETRLGERGGALSGGQRQRIAIARALLRNCPILLLDEATSALDNESEALVQKALDRLMENRTVIVIAHRLSTVRHADQIVVMHQGRVIEQGTHEELLARGGKYAEFSTREFRRQPDSEEEKPAGGRNFEPVFE